jgi:hypothetical protein
MGVAHLALGNPGAPPPSGNGRLLLFELIVATDLAIGLFRIWRLRYWRQKAAAQGRIVRRSLASIEVLIPAAFLLGFPRLVGVAVGEKVSWPGFFDFVPDVALWFIASATLSLVRGAAKVVILARSAG